MLWHIMRDMLDLAGITNPWRCPAAELLGLNFSVSLPPSELLDLADQLDVDGMMDSGG